MCARLYLTIGAAAICAFLVPPGRAHAAAPSYTVTVLGTLGGFGATGYSINASGVVAGSSFFTGNSAEHAVRWTGTTPTALGTLGGSSSYGYGINASGDVTGMSSTMGDAGSHTFLYTQGAMYDLSDLLLTPVSVPETSSSLMMMMLGCFALLGSRQHSRRGHRS